MTPQMNPPTAERGPTLELVTTTLHNGVIAPTVHFGRGLFVHCSNLVV